MEEYHSRFQQEEQEESEEESENESSKEGVEGEESSKEGVEGKESSKEGVKEKWQGGLVDYDDESEEENGDTQESRKRGRSTSASDTEEGKTKSKESLSSPIHDGSAKRPKLDSSISSQDDQDKVAEMKGVELQPSLETRALSNLGAQPEAGDEVEMQDRTQQSFQQIIDEKKVSEQQIDENEVGENGDGSIEKNEVNPETDREEDEKLESSENKSEDEKLENEEQKEDVPPRVQEEEERKVYAEEECQEEENKKMVGSNIGRPAEDVDKDDNDNAQMTNQETIENVSTSSDSSDNELVGDSSEKKPMMFFSNECLSNDPFDVSDVLPQKDSEEVEDKSPESSQASNDSWFDDASKQPEDVEPSNEYSEDVLENGEMNDLLMSGDEHEDDEVVDLDDDDQDHLDEEDQDHLDEEDQDQDQFEEDEDEEVAENYRDVFPITTEHGEAVSTSSNGLNVLKWVPLEEAHNEESDQFVDPTNEKQSMDLVIKLLNNFSKEALRKMPDMLDPKAKEYLSLAFPKSATPAYPDPAMQGYLGAHRFGGHMPNMPNMPMYQQPGMGYPGYPGMQMQQTPYLEQQQQHMQRMLLQQQQQQAAAARAPPAPRSPPPPPQPKKYCQYPPPNTNDGVAAITVTPADYVVLKKETFLNDVIIDFFLKYLQYGKFKDEVKQNIHIFSTYFYDTLTKKRGGEIIESDPVKAAFKRYDRVKRWTRKVNLFEKDFVVVPINENYHWYVCIICYPGQDGCVDTQTREPCDRPKKQAKRSKKKERKVRLATAKSIRTEEITNKDRDEAAGDEIDMEDEEDTYEKKRRKKKTKETDQNYGYADNGDEYGDEENVYNEHVDGMDEDGWEYEQEGDHEVVDGGEEAEDEEEADHGEEEIVGSSEGDVIISSEGDVVKDTEDESFMDNQNSLDSSEMDASKAFQEYQGDDEVDPEEYPHADEEDFDESDEDKMDEVLDEEKLEHKMEEVLDEDKLEHILDDEEVEEVLEVKKDVEVSSPKENPEENMPDDNSSEVDQENPDAVQINASSAEKEDGPNHVEETFEKLDKVVEEKADYDGITLDNQAKKEVKETVDDERIIPDNRPKKDSVESLENGEKVEIQANGDTVNNLDNGKIEDLNGETEKMNGKMDDNDDEIEKDKEDFKDTKEKELMDDNDEIEKDKEDVKESKEKELSVESNISQVDGSIDLKDDEESENAEAKEPEEQVDETSNPSQVDEEEENQQQKEDLELPIITLSKIEPDPDMIKKVAETQSDGDKTDSHVDEEGDVMIEESTESLEEQEVIVNKPEADSDKGDATDATSGKDQVDIEAAKPEDEVLAKGATPLLHKESNLEKKSSKIADLESMWSDPEDEDMEQEESTLDQINSSDLPNAKTDQNKVDVEGESLKELVNDVLKDHTGDEERMGDEANEKVDEEDMGDELIENIGEEGLGDETVEQIDDDGMEDTEMESDDDEVTLKQPSGEFKMPVLPPGMSIQRQRDSVLDDFESGIENLNNDIEPDFDNKSSDDDLTEEELEDDDLDSNERQNQLPPSVFERLLQNREGGSMEEYHSRFQQEEQEESEEESEIESSEDEEEEEVRPVRQPCILVFDSLGGTKDKYRKSKVCNTIREYLNCEYRTKQGTDQDKFTKDYMPASSPKVQQQPNFHDCGIYLLQFVESFFTNPINDFTLPITSIKEWFPEEGEDGVNNKRANIAKLIQDFTKEQNPGMDIRFPNLSFRSTPAAPPPEHEPEEEYYSDEDEDGYSEEGSDGGDPDPYSQHPQYSGHQQQRQYPQYRSPYEAPQQPMFGKPPPAAASRLNAPSHHDQLQMNLSNLPAGISLSRQVQNVLNESDDDIIVDEGSSSKIQKNEWVEYTDQFGRTRQCLRSDFEAARQDQLGDDDWENNYDEDGEEYYEEASSPLEIIEEKDGEQEEDYEDERMDAVSPFVSMVSHQPLRIDDLLPSMVAHQPLQQRVLELKERKEVPDFRLIGSMVSHQVSSFGGQAINEEPIQVDNVSEVIMKEVVSSDAGVVDIDDSDEEVEDEEEEAMETSQDVDEEEAPTPIEEPAGEMESKTSLSPDTTTNIQDEDDCVTTNIENDCVASSSTKEPAVIEIDKSVAQNDTDVEMSVDDTPEVKDESHPSIVDDTSDVNPDEVFMNTSSLPVEVQDQVEPTKEEKDESHPSIVDDTSAVNPDEVFMNISSLPVEVQDQVEPTKDESNPSVVDDKKALNDANVEALPDSDEDMDSDTNIEDSEDKVEAEAVLDGERIGQVDGCYDLEDEETEDAEDQPKQVVPCDDVKDSPEAEQIPPKIQNEPREEAKKETEQITTEIDSSFERDQVSLKIEDEPREEAQKETEQITPEVDDSFESDKVGPKNDYKSVDEALDQTEQIASEVDDSNGDQDSSKIDEAPTKEAQDKAEQVSQEIKILSTNNEMDSNDAKHDTGSDMLDTVEDSTQQVVENIPDLYQDVYSDEDMEGDGVEEEIISSEDENLEDETLDTPKISEFTTNPFFKPQEEVNEAASKILQFEEENYSLLRHHQEQRQPSLLHRETPSQQALSTFGSLPGLSISSSRYIPPFDQSLQTAFNQPISSTPAEQTALLDSEDEDDDDEPGEVFIKGNRLYQRRGKKQKKQGRLGKYLCRDDRGIISVRSELPKNNNKSHNIQEVKNNFTENLILETLSRSSVVKTSELANHEEDDNDSHQVIDSSYEDENEESFEDNANENYEFVPDPAYASEDSRSKVSVIKELDEDSVDSEESVKPQTLTAVLAEL